MAERARPAAGAAKGMAAVRGGFQMREVKPVGYSEIESRTTRASLPGWRSSTACSAAGSCRAASSSSAATQA